MPDNSLPKPVLPKDPQGGVGVDKIQMPPSTRMPAPPVSGPPGVAPLATGPRMNPPGPVASSQGVQPSSPPGSLPKMSPPNFGPGMSQPPLSGLPPHSSPQSQATLPTSSSPSSSFPPSTQSPQVTAAPKVTESPLTNSENNKKKPKFASVKGSPFKYLPFIVGGLVLIGIIVFVFNKIKGSQSTPVVPEKTTQPAAQGTQPDTRKTVPAEQVNLTYWGLWEPDNTITTVLGKFESANPGVKVNYVKQSHKDYRERLQTAVASGNGPDVFRYHASWVPMLKAELSPMPQAVMSSTEYQQTFYPSASVQLNINGQIVGIPLMYEGLGLYYNKEMLTAANSQPPATWAELKTLATKLTVREGGKVKRGGMAIGNASNVEHFADILALLMLQNGADFQDPTSKEAQDALAFYTNFFKNDKVWSEELPSSTVAFARGDVAMMLAPSWRAHEVQLMNSDLKFGIAPVPRLGDTRLAWASFWAEGVSNKSTHKDKAWALLKFLSSKEIQQELYSNQKQVRSFGELYSRVDLADELASDELVAPFLQDAPYATGWHLSSYTHDNGVNDLLIKYYEDAINAVLDGKSVEDALLTVDQGTQQVLRQYGIE